MSFEQSIDLDLKEGLESDRFSEGEVAKSLKSKRSVEASTTPNKKMNIRLDEVSFYRVSPQLLEMKKGRNRVFLRGGLLF